MTWNYVYDSETGQLERAVCSNGISVEYVYDKAKERLQQLLVKRSGKAVDPVDVSYLYDEKDRPTGVKLNSMDGGTVICSYDTLDRVTETAHTIKASAPDTKILTKLEYETVDGNETGLITRYQTQKKIGGTEQSINDLHYTYDEEGNILTIKEGTEIIVEYTYDALGQMTTENANGEEFVYTYDGAGNILKKEKADGTVVHTWQYTDPKWPDKLMKFDGKATTNEYNGNPKTYDSYILTWQQGRQLKTITGHGLTMSYTYNQDGLRTKKSNGTISQVFSYVGDKLVRQADGGAKTLNFTYDESGSILGVQYNNVNYYYLKNLQGDIIGIYNTSGDVVCRYVYDAWGNILSVKNASDIDITDQNHIANVNPIRYRGYYYDTETKWYYLQSRYYVPEWGRFLNADAYTDTGNSILSTNMFAYCENDPVNRYDPTGQAFVKVRTDINITPAGYILFNQLTSVQLNLASYELTDASLETYKFRGQSSASSPTTTHTITSMATVFSWKRWYAATNYIYYAYGGLVSAYNALIKRVKDFISMKDWGSIIAGLALKTKAVSTVAAAMAKLLPYATQIAGIIGISVGLALLLISEAADKLTFTLNNRDGKLFYVLVWKITQYTHLLIGGDTTANVYLFHAVAAFI